VLGPIQRDISRLNGEMSTLTANFTSIQLNLQIILGMLQERPVLQRLQEEEQIEIQDIQAEVQVEEMEGPVDKGFFVPSVKSVKQIMEQWENGGKRFRPLKNWNHLYICSKLLYLTGIFLEHCVFFVAQEQCVFLWRKAA
jgi:hypothetical protein